jgi:hypothetical protein
MSSRTHIAAALIAFSIPLGASAQAAAPTMSPSPGAFTTSQNVSLSCSTPACSIRYTTDGTAVSSISRQYTGPFSVTTSSVIKAIALASGYGQSPVATGIYIIDPLTGTQLAFHTVQLDGGNSLLPWLPTGYAYGEAVKRNITRTLQYPFSDVNTHAALTWPPSGGTAGSPNNPAGKNSMLADSALLAYPYTGDPAFINLVVQLYDYQLAHGMTGTTGYSWQHVPYASAADGAATFDGNSPEEGLYVIEPDKVGEWGWGAILLYEFTGNTVYRDAAIDGANALASHVVTGNASISPWPWRVHAQTNATIEDYCAHTAGAIRLFDELIRLNLGSVASYTTARATAWNWTVTYPLANGGWGRYFEDQPTPQSRSNVNQYNPGQLARYLLEHQEKDASWLAHVNTIVAWIEANFAQPAYGANAIGEQAYWNYVMESHTSRYGAVNALLAEATGNATAKNKAFRAMNWASYLMQNDGTTMVGPSQPAMWFTDSIGDFIRHFMIAMATNPAEWAPAGEDHLLRSTTVVKGVAYSSGRVDYQTFDRAAQEVLRLTFSPTTVLANGLALSQRTDLTQEGWTFDAATGVLRVRHDSATSIAVAGAAAALPISPTVATAPPRGNIAFSSMGGSGPYAWSLSTNASGGAINSSTGVYTAGPTASVTDVVRVTDSTGSTATRNVNVGPGITIQPLTANVAANGVLTFSASGGSGTGFAWALATNVSGGAINSSTGAYTAGPTASVTDVIRVTDSLGNTASRNVSVAPASASLDIAPVLASAPPRGSIAFAATGGSGPYTWSLPTTASGGTIDSSTGAYRAGPTGNVTDIVRVADSGSRSATRSVMVTAGVSVLPATATVPAGGALTFTASGGSGSGFAWTLSTNASGGSVDASSGAYTAGSIGGVTDVVKASDALGNTATATVTVTVAATGGGGPPAQVTGGCSTGTPGLSPLLALPLVLRLRRTRVRQRQHREPTRKALREAAGSYRQEAPISAGGGASWRDLDRPGSTWRC